jgi:hypothetical protein
MQYICVLMEISHRTLLFRYCSVETHDVVDTEIYCVISVNCRTQLVNDNSVT